MPHLPSTWRPSTDRVGIIILGLITTARGLSYLPSIVPDGHRIPALETVAPLETWFSVWITIGLATITAGIIGRFQATAFGLLAGINTLWGMLYITAWILGQSDRGYVTALSYLSIAFLITWAVGRGRAQTPNDERR